MDIRECVTQNYVIVHHEAGVASIRDKLFCNQYVVVADDINKYIGLLSLTDLVLKPHNLVVDCLTEKQKLSPDDTISTIVEKFHKCKSPALPFFENGEFAGVIEKNCVIDQMRVLVESLYNNSVINQTLRKNFLNNISHEVRTPLSILIGFLDVIAEIDVEKFKDESGEYRLMLKHNIDSFLAMINDLIDLSKLDSGETIENEVSRINVKTLFGDLRDFFETRAKILKKDVRFNFVIEEGCETINADHKKLRQIMYSLLDNACKFTVDNLVECICRFTNVGEERHMVFSVSNSSDFNETDIEGDIFDAFNKDYSGKNYKTGLGIGLSLSKKLSDTMGFDLTFKNGGGKTAFYLDTKK